MKFSLLLAVILTASCASKHQHPATKAEMTEAMKTNEAQAVVQNMISANESKDWKQFEKSFARRTVFFSGEPLLLKPEEISHLVKPTQKYFDATQATLSDFKLKEVQGRLLGSGKISTNFWKNRGLGSDVATTDNKVDFEFTRENGELKIMRIQPVEMKVKGEKDLIKTAWEKGDHDIRYRVEIVDFPSKNGKQMRGWLYRPFEAVHDVVILNGNVGNIKEQGSLPYARLLAGRGIATLVFDFVNFGESEGNVRNLEDPGQKIDDFRGAVDFVANLEAYAGSRISLAGLGSSAGYIAHAAATDNRVDRVLMISPFLHSRLVEKQQFEAGRKLSAAREANHQFQQDEVLTYIPVASFSENNAVLTSNAESDIDYYLNPERGNIPQWQNQFATMGWTPWINFDATTAAPRIRVPTLVIHSKSGPFAEGVDDFVGKMRVKPEIHVVSASPYDFYDRPETMNQVVKIIEDFLDPSMSDTEITSL
ncbi:MAG: hypothetical protein V4598_16420 [Bdellovibrionota bacterium]